MSKIGRSSSKHCTIVRLKTKMLKRLIFNLKALNVMSSVSQSFCKVETLETKRRLFNEIQKSFSSHPCLIFFDTKVWNGVPHMCHLTTIHAHKQTRRWPRRNIIILVSFVQLTVLADFLGSDSLMGRWALPGMNEAWFPETHGALISGTYGV